MVPVAAPAITWRMVTEFGAKPFGVLSAALMLWEPTVRLLVVKVTEEFVQALRIDGLSSEQGQKTPIIVKETNDAAGGNVGTIVAEGETVAVRVKGWPGSVRIERELTEADRIGIAADNLLQEIFSAPGHGGYRQHGLP